MSFVIRTVTTSATGREIVRTNAIAGDTVTIGRDPASDIHLTDLEVTHRHATIQRIGPRQVVVAAVAELPLIVDGASTKRQELDAGRGGEVRIGAARIVVSAGDDDAIGLAVTRVEQPPTGEREADKRFSLAGAMPGKRPMAWASALLVLALFLVWPIWSFGQQPARLTDAQMAAGYSHIDQSWSAGALSQAHAGLERDCKACHTGAFVAVKDESCQACHKVADHADPTRLLAAHPAPGGIEGAKWQVAAMFGRGAGRCVDCHLEHQGALPEPKLVGASCVDCHADLKARLPSTRLGNAGDFATSHPQFMPLVQTRAGDDPAFARISLDQNPRQDSGLKFPHALHMSPRGGAARMALSMGGKLPACADCHTPDDSGARFKPVTMEKNCQGCHSLAFDRVGGTVRTLRHGEPDQVVADIRDFWAAHPGGGGVARLGGDRRRPGEAGVPGYHVAVGGGGGGAAGAVRAVFSKGGACYDCHVVPPPSRAGGLDYGVAKVNQQLRYLKHGWFDHAAHDTETCQSCHADALRSNDWHKVMLPDVKSCRTCHGGAKARAPLIKSSCVMCHDYHHGDGAPDGARDDKTARAGAPLKLEWMGGHAVADRADLGPAPGLRPRRSG